MNDNTEKITIISTTAGRIMVTLPDIRFNREWPRAGSKVVVDKDVLEEMMFDQGTKYLFDTGMLYIEDMKVKQELGLEPEDAEEPVNIIVLKADQKKRALTHMPGFEFKELLSTLSSEQKHDLVNYAIDNDIIPDMEKVNLLQEATHVDLLNAINLKRKQEVK